MIKKNLHLLSCLYRILRYQKNISECVCRSCGQWFVFDFCSVNSLRDSVKIDFANIKGYKYFRILESPSLTWSNKLFIEKSLCRCIRSSILPFFRLYTKIVSCSINFLDNWFFSLLMECSTDDFDEAPSARGDACFVKDEEV